MDATRTAKALLVSPKHGAVIGGTYPDHFIAFTETVMREIAQSETPLVLASEIKAS